MPNTSPNLIAAGDIRPNRYVKIDSTAGNSHYGLEADANEKVIGICGGETTQPPLSDLVTTALHASSGKHIHLYGDGDECLLEISATVVQGDRLKSDGDGKGTPVATSGTTLQEYGAIALEAGSSGDKIRVQVTLGSVRPAIA